MSRKETPRKGLFFTRCGMAAVRLVAAGANRVPPAAWAWGAAALAPFFWWGFPSYRKRTVRNLVQSGFPPKEARRMGIRSYRSNMLVAIESLAMDRLLSRRGVQVDFRVTPAAEEIFRRVKSGEAPLAVAVTGHTGVWELLGAELARRCAPVETLVTVQLTGNPVLDAFLQELRGRTGMVPVAKERFLRTVLQRLRRKQPCVAAFLCDLHYKGGVKVPFLGRTACTVPAPAELAVRYDAPLLHGYCLRERAGRYRMVMDGLPAPPGRERGDRAAVEETLGFINRSIERAVARAPEQWIWSHKRWKGCCGAAQSAALDSWNPGPLAGAPPSRSPPG